MIMKANKNGFYYVIDRITGKFISGRPFAMVTWARGLNEETGRPIVNPEAHYGAQPIALAPGPGGAHNWAPRSFNPATGLVYVPASLANTRNYSYNPNFQYKEGLMNTGQAYGRAANLNLAGAPTTLPQPLPPPPAIGPTPLAGVVRWALLAWDIVTQEERWRTSAGGEAGGGTLATAGNLVIQVVPDGRLIAYTADKGDKLLEMQTGIREGIGLRLPTCWIAGNTSLSREARAAGAIRKHQIAKPNKEQVSPSRAWCLCRRASDSQTVRLHARR